MTSSNAIVQYAKTISDSNKRTGYEYLKRLEHFERFVSDNYHFGIDELTINKMFDVNIYDLLSSYVSHLINRKDDNGHSISNLTIKQRVVTAKNFLEFHDIEISPRKFKLKVKTPRIINRHKEPLSKEDVVKILETCAFIKVKTYVLFLAATGTRAIEACSIRLMDIDFEKCKVHIRGEYTKTKVDRDVYLTTELMEQLKLWLDYKYRTRVKYSKQYRRNFTYTPTKNDTDLIFASSFLFDYDNNNNEDGKTKLKSKTNSKRGEYRTIVGLYVTLVTHFNKIIDELKIGHEDATKRRRKITFHSFRRFVKTTISDLGYQDFSNFFIGHAQSTYWRKPEKEKFQLFKKIESYLTYLDQTSLERKGADLQNRLEVMEQENKGLQERYERDMKSMQDKMNQIMEMIQHNPSLANVKPEVLAKKIR
jgi:integrase